MTLDELDVPAGFAERFWAKVDRTAEGCWEWPGAQNGRGYGHVGWHRRMVAHSMYAHRMAYMLEHGAIPDGMQVCHHCDNRICIRPSHLFVGTSHDNHMDMMAKGRHTPPALRGERSPHATLTDAQALEIRERYDRGERTRDLAAAYGVSANVVSKIARHAKWRHLGGPPPERERRQTRGELSHLAKLNADQVREIRTRHAAGTPRSVLAKDYGVRPETIWHVVKRKTWAHVT